MVGVTPQAMAHDMPAWGHEAVNVVFVHHAGQTAQPAVRVAPPQLGAQLGPQVGPSSASRPVAGHSAWPRNSLNFSRNGASWGTRAMHWPLSRPDMCQSSMTFPSTTVCLTPSWRTGA